MSVTAQQILNARLKTQKVATPEWGGDVYVRMIRGDEVNDLVKLAGKASDAESMAWICQFCLCDSKGKRLFNGAATPKGLLAGPLAPLRRTCEAAMSLNGMTGDSDAEEK